MINEEEPVSRKPKCTQVPSVAGDGDVLDVADNPSKKDRNKT